MTDRKDIPVAIVSPDPYFLFAARGMLGKDRRARICSTANSLEAFRSDLSSNKPIVKVVVCDLDALGPLPAFFKALAGLMADYPSMAVICLAEGTIEQVVPYLENTSIDALLSKHDLSYGLHLAIHTVVDHGVVLLTQSICQQLSHQSYLARQGRVIDIEQSHPDLTGRVEEVAICRMVIGLSNPDIQDELLLSSNTVRHYVHKVYQRLGASGEQDAFDALSEWWWLTRFSGVLDGNLHCACP